MIGWNRIVVSIFSRAFNPSEPVARRKFAAGQEQRIARRTRQLAVALNGRRKTLRKLAEHFVTLIEKNLSNEVVKQLNKVDFKETLAERAERTLVRLSQVIEEQLPREARVRGDAEFRISRGPDEVVGCWFWQEGHHHQGEVPMRRAAVHAARIGGEFDDDYATAIGDELLRAIIAQEISIPNLPFAKKHEEVTALRWSSPVIELKGVSSAIKKGSDVAIDISVSEDDLIVHNYSVELSELLDQMLSADVVERDIAKSDTTKINVKTFNAIIELLSKTLRVDSSAIFARLRMLALDQGRMDVHADNDKMEDITRRLEKLTRLLDTPVTV
jgi:hypothetical protein